MNFLFKSLLAASIGLVVLHADFLETQSAQALKEKKLILLNIESEDCPYCQKMKKEIFNDALYRKQIDQRFIFVSKNVNDPSLPPVFRVQSVPANAILEPSSKEIVDAYTGYIEPKTFMGILDEAYKAKMK